MAKQKAIMRTLGAVESLGNVTNICTDKTGTLTEGKMVATHLWTSDSKIVGVLEDRFSLNDSSKLAITISSLCNTSSVIREIIDGKEEWKGIGSPTEVAMAILGEKMNISRSTLSNEWNFHREFPFDSTIKRMSIIYSNNDKKGLYVFTKGAPDTLLPCCSSVFCGLSEEPQPLSEKFSDVIMQKNEEMANEGLRVLGLCWKQFEDEKQDRDIIEKNLTFVGLIGIRDPPRESVPSSIKTCHEAGITVHMVTGDHITTAKAIAKQIGILPMNLSEEEENNLVITALDFEAMTDFEVSALPQLPLVIARCSPER